MTIVGSWHDDRGEWLAQHSPVSILERFDQLGRTALMWAAERGLVKTVMALIERARSSYTSGPIYDVSGREMLLACPGFVTYTYVDQRQWAIIPVRFGRNALQIMVESKRALKEDVNPALHKALVDAIAFHTTNYKPAVAALLWRSFGVMLSVPSVRSVPSVPSVLCGNAVALPVTTSSATLPRELISLICVYLDVPLPPT